MLAVRFDIGKAKASKPLDGFIPNPKLKLLDQVSEVMRFKHYPIRTEETYREWIRRFILFHGKRHPREMGAEAGSEALIYYNKPVLTHVLTPGKMMPQDYQGIRTAAWSGDTAVLISVHQRKSAVSLNTCPP